MKLVFATTNRNKAREVAQILEPWGIRVARLDEFRGPFPEPHENADTFEGNARLKASAYAQLVGLPCLADDSGLEVDALAGAPGVRSARYAGLGETRGERDQANREKLLRELHKLGDVPRHARLVCALCLSDERGHVLFQGRGTLEGRIIDEARGEHGFGYDVHLFLPDVGLTAAELSSEAMNERSHRGCALRQLGNWLREHGAIGA